MQPCGGIVAAYSGDVGGGVGDVQQLKVLVNLALVLVFAGGCAAGEGNAGSTIAEEETTAHSAQEETTGLERGYGIPRPPDGTLSYGGREVKGTLGSYCWYSDNSGGCVDKVWPLIPSKQKTLTVPSDSEMVFRYGGQSPPDKVEVRAYALNKLQKTGTMRPDSSLDNKASGVQTTIPAGLPPEEYVLEVSVKELPDSGAGYYFRVIVK